ncbi:MAG: hypothetical protein D6679_09095 [Candidatus Hydrogenedentota bacterium]|nr:MAG: hypothetical protein D6679_09095 [Candidatus Hydrogenedentota bacterium]
MGLISLRSLLIEGFRKPVGDKIDGSERKNRDQRRHHPHLDERLPGSIFPRKPRSLSTRKYHLLLFLPSSLLRSGPDSTFESRLPI